MAEEWGAVVFEIVDDLRVACDDLSTITDPAALLIAVGGISPERTEDLILNADEISVRDSYVMFEYDCADWRAFSELFVAHGNGLEFYSRTLDEYGSSGYFALRGDSNRFAFSYDENGDMFDVDGYEEEVERKIDEWTQLLPEPLKEQFPEFAGIDKS